MNHWRLIKNLTSHALNKTEAVLESLATIPHGNGNSLILYCQECLRFQKDAYLLSLWQFNKFEMKLPVDERHKLYERYIEENYIFAKQLKKNLDDPFSQELFYIKLFRRLYGEAIVKDVKMRELLVDSIEEKHKINDIISVINGNDLLGIDNVREIIWKKAGIWKQG